MSDNPAVGKVNRRTADEFQVKVGKYVAMPVPDADTGWRLIEHIRNCSILGVTPAPASLQKRRVYPWQEVRG